MKLAAIQEIMLIARYTQLSSYWNMNIQIKTSIKHFSLLVGGLPIYLLHKWK